MLKRKDLKFRLANRHKEFAVAQFAQFMKPTDVVTAVMEKFETELAIDKEKYGEGEIRRYLSHNFWVLDPKNRKMPEKFKEHYELTKRQYLKIYADSYLSHPRNIIRELDTLYEKCTQQLENGDPDKIRQLVPTMLKIIQAIQNTLNAIPPEEMESEEKILEKIQVVHLLNWTMVTPDPLEEKEAQTLKEMIEANAPFEEIRHFVEYLRCKNQDVYVRYNPEKKKTHILEAGVSPSNSFLKRTRKDHPTPASSGMQIGTYQST